MEALKPARKRALQPTLITLIALVAAMTLSACNDAGLAGDSGKRADKQNPAVTGTPKPSKKPGAPDGPGVPDAGDDTDEGEGPDGTTTEDEDEPEVNPPLVTDDGEIAAMDHACKEGVPQIYQVTGTGNSVTVKGEICPRAFGKLSVLFIVDFSGSMADADGRFFCGRASAARRILDKIKKDMRSGDDVQVGSIGFGDTAAVRSSLGPINNFYANVFNFCDESMGATNYKAAFDLALTQFQNVPGNKVVYFISDGLPTTGGAGAPSNNDAAGVHKAAGLQSAQAFVAGLQNLTLSAIYLGGAGGGAQTYLGKITGDPSRVKLASDASQLADKIVELSIPKVELQAASVTAELTAPGFAAKPVKLDLFDKDPTKPGAWIFKTETIVLNKQAGATVDNVLSIKALDQSGTAHEEKLTIRRIAP